MVRVGTAHASHKEKGQDLGSIAAVVSDDPLQRASLVYTFTIHKVLAARVEMN